MDPQKLIFLDKKVVGSERLISLLFTIALSVVLVMMQRGVIVTANFSTPVFWIGLIGFIGLGLVQYFWNPYTRVKVLVYDFLFAIVGALVSVFIVGFSSPLVFLGWMMLIITAAVYFKQAVTVSIYGIFLASVFLWLYLNRTELSLGESIASIVSAVLVGFVASYVIEIWSLFSRSVKQLDSSIGNERLVRERLSSLINSMADGVMAVDEQCRVIEYNGALLNILDLNLTLKDKDISVIGKFVDANNQAVSLKEFVLNTKSQQINRDYRIVYNDKSQANLYISVASVHLGFGHEYTKGFVLVMRDITREKSLEEERDEFISVISHEIRTPIAIAEGEVSNAAFLAEKSSDKKKVAEAIKQAYQQIIFLSDMVNDLSTLSRAERSKLKVEVEPIDLNQLIDELEKDYSSQAKQKNLDLKVEIEKNIGKLSSSKLYVREVLQNFITNAIKYTEAGSITILASPTKQGVKFEIKDTGIGISKSDQEKVFDKFFRSEDYRTRANSGTGLGLYVTMKLAKLIHAEIELSSELNKGSTFTIDIPNLS